MNQNDAMDVAQAWHGLHDDRGAAQDASAHLWRALISLLPEISTAGAITLEGTPTIIAVSTSSLFAVTLDIAEPSRAVSVRRRGVDLRVANATVRETLEETRDHPAVSSLKRIRDWMFDPGDGGGTWSWTTRQVIVGGLKSDQDVPPEERLARHVAAALGWQMTTLEETGPDWAD
jgi:hypothetical protein